MKPLSISIPHNGKQMPDNYDRQSTDGQESPCQLASLQPKCWLKSLVRLPRRIPNTVVLLSCQERRRTAISKISTSRMSGALVGNQTDFSNQRVAQRMICLTFGKRTVSHACYKSQRLKRLWS